MNLIENNWACIVKDVYQAFVNLIFSKTYENLSLTDGTECSNITLTISKDQYLHFCSRIKLARGEPAKF